MIRPRDFRLLRVPVPLPAAVLRGLFRHALPLAELAHPDPVLGLLCLVAGRFPGAAGRRHRLHLRHRPGHGPRRPEARGAAPRLLVLGLVGNLGVLAYFKYANFGVASLNALLLPPASPHALGRDRAAHRPVVLCAAVGQLPHRCPARRRPGQPPLRRLRRLQGDLRPAHRRPHRPLRRDRAGAAAPAAIPWRNSASAPAASCSASP